MPDFLSPLIPAEAGIQDKSAQAVGNWRGEGRPSLSRSSADLPWIPASAGMSGVGSFALGILTILAFCLAASSALAAGDAAKGKQVFDNSCSGCHVLTGQGFSGPALAGVYRRKAGGDPGFMYSDALKKSGIVWDDAHLSSFLADPTKLVSGTSMYFTLTSLQDRDDVIAYLKSLSSPSSP
jgi:cytochrome c